MGYTEKVVVIGAGISGLACAFRLKRAGVLPLVLEGGDRPGGVIATVRKAGFLFEAGPQCPRFAKSVWNLLRDLNVESEFVAGDPKAKRYILRNGRLHRAPLSPFGLLATGLLSPASKFRILSEAFRSSKAPLKEESVAAFVQRKFGSEILDNFVDPLISTIFFGDSYNMSMAAFPALLEWERQHGSLARGALRALQSRRSSRIPPDVSPSPSARAKHTSLRVTDSLPSLGSLRLGMGALPEALANELGTEIRYRAGVQNVAPLQGTGNVSHANWEVCLSNGERIATEHLVLAVPAYRAAQLLTASVPALASCLAAIEYAPICVISSGYRRADLQHRLDGFGFMVPRREGLQTICTFWNSSLFPQRAPEGRVLVTSFAGRESHGEDAATSDGQCASTVEAENARILGIGRPPEEQMVWGNARALPQYNVGHAHLVEEIRAILRTLPRLHLVGNFLAGRSIGDCVDIAVRAAQDVHSRLGS